MSLFKIFSKEKKKPIVIITREEDHVLSSNAPTIRKRVILSYENIRVHNVNKETSLFLTHFSSFFIRTSKRKLPYEFSELSVEGDGEILFSKEMWWTRDFVENPLKLDLAKYKEVKIHYRLLAFERYNCEKDIKKYDGKLRKNVTREAFLSVGENPGLLVYTYGENGHELLIYRKDYIDSDEVDIWEVRNARINFTLNPSSRTESSFNLLRESFKRVEDLIGVKYTDEIFGDSLDKPSGRIYFSGDFSVTHSDLTLLRCIFAEMIREVGRENFEEIKVNFFGIGKKNGKYLPEAVGVMENGGEVFAKYAVSVNK